MTLPWILQLILYPLDALDLKDRFGRADHGKVMGFFIFLAFLAMIFLKVLPSIGHTMAIISAAYGFNMFREFMKLKSVSYNQTVNENISVAISETRDITRGVQPTP